MKSERRSMLVMAVVAGFMIGALSLPGDLRSGSLEPTDPPGPTMKTLDEIPPTWSQVLPVSERFEIVLSGQAVLDKETGLVWEQSPTGSLEWDDAMDYCYDLELGGRKGWRLPSVEELASLVDPTQAEPALPPGHPFSNIVNWYYWSSTTRFDVPTSARCVAHHHNGLVSIGYKTSFYYVWCMRGGRGHDAY